MLVSCAGFEIACWGTPTWMFCWWMYIWGTQLPPSLGGIIYHSPLGCWKEFNLREQIFVYVFTGVHPRCSLETLGVWKVEFIDLFLSSVWSFHLHNSVSAGICFKCIFTFFLWSQFVRREGVIKRSHIHQDSFLEREQGCMHVSLEHWPCFSPYREYLIMVTRWFFSLWRHTTMFPKTLGCSRCQWGVFFLSASCVSTLYTLIQTFCIL